MGGKWWPRWAASRCQSVALRASIIAISATRQSRAKLLLSGSPPLSQA